MEPRLAKRGMIAAMETETSTAPGESLATVSQRLRKYALWCYLVFAAGTLITADSWAFVGLTCSALVVMIGHLWLERILEKTLLPGPRVSPWQIGVQVLTRFALMGIVLAIGILFARFSPVSVLLGFSVIVCAVLIEATHSLFGPGSATD